jgi:replicative DNA helicase
MNRDQFTELPHSAEAEDAILGGLMSNGQAINWTAGLLPDAFFQPFESAAFRAAQELGAQGLSIDPIAIYEHMREANPAVSAKCLEALQEMCGSWWKITEKQFRAYARMVVDHYRLRELARVGGEIAALGLERGGADKQIDAAQMLLAKLATVKSKREPQHINESLRDYLQLLTDLSEGKNPAMATGIVGLDRLLNGGLRRGEVTVIGARPKHGKTALALALARNLARAHPVLFLSQEMQVFQLMHRHTAAMGGFDLGAIMRADPTDAEMWHAVTDAAESLGRLQLVHDEQCALTLLDIRRKAIKVRREHGLDVLFVDFLQLMNGAGEENRNRELDVIVNGIKALAMDLGVAVVVLSQMSREADKHYGKPTMTHLRDSGAIEAAADQVALLFTDWAHPLSKKDQAFEQFSELEIVAHRNGPTGTVPLRFVGRHQQFGDWLGARPHRIGKSGSDFE